MKILVLSDSHSYSDFMQRCMDACRPDAVIHLGDYVSDGKDLRRLYPEIPLSSARELRFLPLRSGYDAYHYRKPFRRQADADPRA